MKNILLRSGFVLFAAVVMMSALVLSSCNDSATDVVATADDGSNSAPLTMSEIRAAVDMTDSQAATVSSALARFHRDTTAPPGPALTFLAASAQTLDHKQMRSLVQCMADRQAGLNGPRHEGRGHGWGRGPRNGHGPRDRGEGPLASLNLSEEQKAQIEAARQARHDASKPIFDALRDGSMAKEEARAALKEIHDTFRAALEEILTDEQIATLESQRTARMISHLTKQIERIESEEIRMLGKLAEILGLSDDQVTEIKAITAATIPAMKDVLAGLQGGSLNTAAAHEALQQIREDKRSAITEVLTDEQRELFDELVKLQHRHGRRRGRG